MRERNISALFMQWMSNVHDEEIKSELISLQKAGEISVNDAFFKDLTFGTGGLRGIIGAGTNRMNVYTVARATQGLADYLNAHFENPSVAMARDSRNKGEEFTRCAASVLAANGVRVLAYPRVEPTPALSFAVRDLGCSAGINLTASHNPAAYNGYKVYGADGCQITDVAANEISSFIDKVSHFGDAKTMDFDEALESGLISWIGEDTLDRFVEAVLEQSCEGPEDAASPLKVVYTPLSGTGMECVSRVLERIGGVKVVVVPEQCEPNGDFPTCPYPNPEERAALELGIRLCEEERPDLLLATDPDTDRVAAACKDGEDYAIITGNEMGILLMDWIARQRAARGEDPSRLVGVTTIVSSAMADAVAADHGFELRRTLTGFKYIGEQIAGLEAAGEPERFMLGFEESYGYLAGTHARDKDAVVASMLICQMARAYRREGKTLVEAMRALYERHGWWLDRTISLAYPGADGAQRMEAIMGGLRQEPPAEIAGLRVTSFVDYAPGVEGLPPANVLEFRLEGDAKVIVRPSGTEPKVKAYLFAKGKTRNTADKILELIESVTKNMLS